METSAIEQQIAALQQQLAEQKSTLEKQGVPAQEMPSDREILHEAVGEQIHQAVPSYQSSAPPPSAKSSANDAPSYLTPELQPHVQELVNLTFTKGFGEALKILGQTKNDALTDAFHDVIVDELLKEMVRQGKLPQLPA